MAADAEMNLGRLLDGKAARWGSRTAIVLEGREYTFESLFDEVRRAAAFLDGQGVQAGDRVALFLPKGIPFIVFHLAALVRGAVSLPLNDRFTAVEVRYRLEDSEAAVCVTDRRGAALIGDGGGKPDGCAQIDAGDPAWRCASPGRLTGPPPAGGSDPAMICYTSGTTGRPKGAILSHTNLIENMEALRKAWHWTETDVLLHALPLFHVHGLVVALHGVLNAGSTMKMLPRFEPELVSEELASSGCTLFMGVPTMYHRLAGLWSAAGGPPGLSRVRLFISGSAPLSVELFRRFRRITGHTILDRYGMTETGMIASNPHAVDERIAGSVGLPLEGVSVRVIDPEGRPLADGSVGEVQVRGPNVFRGYWKAEKKTAEAFDGGWFRTGDLGCLKGEGGARLFLKGRRQELIISGGFNVYPREVEEVLEKRADVSEAAVVGLPDSDLGERVVAVVVPRDPEAPPDADEVFAGCREVLAGYKCPQHIFIRDGLPRNAMGKVQKSVLKGLLPP